MNTINDFIEQLKELDPEGNKQIIFDGCFYYCGGDEVEFEVTEDAIIVK